MARFLLIHGASHGAWCWQHVIPALQALGHSAHALDLPSHGADQTAPEDVTLSAYADAIVDALDGPTILVGHSMAGFPISAAAQKAPNNIQRLIYVCAFLPRVGSGQSLADMRRSAKRQPLAPAYQVSKDRKTLTFDPTMIQELFYADCSEADVALARANLCRQAIAPNEDVPELTNVFGDLPKSYIVCRNDAAIPPEFQDEMSAHLPANDVYEMATSHSPFFADPVGLAQMLHRIAQPSAGTLDTAPL